MSEQLKRPERSSGNEKSVSRKMLAGVMRICAIVFVAILIVKFAEAIGWLNLAITILILSFAAGSIFLIIILKRNGDDESEYPNYSPECGRRVQTVTDEEIEEIGILRAPIPPLHDGAVDDPLVDFYGPASQRKKDWW